MSENLEIFDSMVYCWGSVQLMWFVFVKEVDLPPRYAEKVGKKPHGSSGPIMTGIESTSVTMGMEMTDVPYNVTNVISAPNFKCLTAAAAFINAESSLETRLEVTLESLRKTFPGTWQDAVAIFVEKSLHSILEIVTINDPVPLETYAVIGRPASKIFSVSDNIAMLCMLICQQLIVLLAFHL
ncbi:hypothetical protein Tsp_08864 [Trichinella spiralis]|uniref:hypothetical protein n=1 Tax=Trichinella spiralis TaxID=6334 RepID=UPI0001EFE89F|nr:hypothetical protein Tsp_08864 [Trichinella spiralis]